MKVDSTNDNGNPVHLSKKRVHVTYLRYTLEPDKAMFHFCHSRNTTCLFLARILQGRSRYMCTGEEIYTIDCVVRQDMELVLKQ